MMLSESPIIGNACHSLPNWLSNSLPFSKLDLLDACEWWCCVSCLQQAVRESDQSINNDLIVIEMLKLGLVNILNFKFSRDGDV